MFMAWWLQRHGEALAEDQTTTCPRLPVETAGNEACVHRVPYL